MGKRIVIALGGNALGNNLPEQMAAVKHTARAIVDLIEEGHRSGGGPWKRPSGRYDQHRHDHPFPGRSAPTPWPPCLCARP